MRVIKKKHVIHVKGTEHIYVHMNTLFYYINCRLWIESGNKPTTDPNTEEV